MKKKAILAILMAGLMIATVFSAISVSATSNNQQQEIESEPFGDGIAKLRVYVYYDHDKDGEIDYGNESGAAGAIVTVHSFPCIVGERNKMTDDSGWATFYFLILPGETSVGILGIHAETVLVYPKWNGYSSEPIFYITGGDTAIVLIGITQVESIQQSMPSFSFTTGSTPTNR